MFNIISVLCFLCMPCCFTWLSHTSSLDPYAFEDEKTSVKLNDEMKNSVMCTCTIRIVGKKIDILCFVGNFPIFYMSYVILPHL